MTKVLNISHIIIAALIFNFAVAISAIGAPTTKPIKLIAFGDSLTAGYGLPRNAAFPVQLEKSLKAQGHNVQISNAGISGDTASGGLARLDWAIPKGTDAVILELGANDALRGVTPSKTRDSLDKIMARLKARDIPVLITGMIAPQGMGDEFGEAFNSIFSDLAKKYNALHYPFFLNGVALDPKLNQPDGIHPTTKGVAIIVEKIQPSVIKLIRRVKAKTPAITTN